MSSDPAAVYVLSTCSSSVCASSYTGERDVDGTNAIVRARPTDKIQIKDVAALIDGNVTHWLVVPLRHSTLDPTLYESDPTAVPVDPEVAVEVTDGVNVAMSTNKGRQPELRRRDRPLQLRLEDGQGLGRHLPGPGSEAEGRLRAPCELQVHQVATLAAQRAVGALRWLCAP
jgi:hypothetical protein